MLGKELIPPPGAAHQADNVLFNGTHVNADGGGDYYRVTMKPGKRHRLRLINPSVDISYTVSLVDHDMTVISNDFVPVNAFTASSLFLTPGQRLDVTIDASKTPGNYWFNVTFSGLPFCGNLVDGIPPPAAIFSYENAPEPSGIPTDAGTAPPETFCHDNLNFSPVLSQNVDSSSFFSDEDNTLLVELMPKQWEDVPDRIYWDVHGSDMNITWENPTLEYIANGDLDFPEKYNVHSVPNTDSEVKPPLPPYHTHRTGDADTRTTCSGLTGSLRMTASSPIPCISM